MKGEKEALKILHAGALRKPMKECIHLFRKEHPHVEVELDYAGSRACAQAVLEGENVDVIALADPHVFEDLLIPQHIDIFFVFATDQMVLAFDEFSPHSDIINNENWMEILLREGVSFGRSDHNLDPCGYRTLMVWQLAEQYYAKPDLFNSLNNKCGLDWIYSKSIDLCEALLEGRIHYAFIYSSEAEQFNCRYLTFNGKINLSNPAHADYYSRVSVTLSDRSGRVSLVKGSPIEFALGIPKNSANKELAGAFLKVLTSGEGEKILDGCGLISC